jgi:hypothetical protein
MGLGKECAMSSDVPHCESVTVSEKVSLELKIPQMGGKCRGAPGPMRLKGDDGKWRCLNCNEIYVELLYLQMDSMKNLKA